MIERPEVRYVKSGDVSIAYQVFGEGPVDLMCLPGFVSNLYWNWESPGFRRLLTRLGAFARVAILDRRGVGLSDRLSKDLPPLEVLIDDVLAVLDAAGMNRPGVFGWQSASNLAMLLAASNPERVSALATFSANPCGVRKPDWPHSWDEAEWDEYLTDLAAGWGTRAWVDEHTRRFAPDDAGAPWVIHMFQMAASPTTAGQMERLDMQTDVRHILPSIHVPTLILHRPDCSSYPVEIARYLGEQIDGATVVAVPGRDDPPYMGDVDAIADEIEEFLTGVRHGPETDRVLATVLFTDIVDSTSMASGIGDARWTELVADHDELARRAIEDNRGRYVKHTGDGLLATFDGPARAVRCAREIVDAVRPLGIQLRAGVHTGEIELAEDDVRGIAIHIGARVMSLAAPSEIFVSSTVKDLVAGSGLSFEYAGEHELKGVPDTWRLYRVVA
ncbi:MAG: alpha/beta fold hydrolase [Planctomycetaceae bacterium]